MFLSSYACENNHKENILDQRFVGVRLNSYVGIVSKTILWYAGGDAKFPQFLFIFAEYKETKR